MFPTVLPEMEKTNRALLFQKTKVGKMGTKRKRRRLTRKEKIELSKSGRMPRRLIEELNKMETPK